MAADCGDRSRAQPVWIPACAGMTVGGWGRYRHAAGPAEGKGCRRDGPRYKGGANWTPAVRRGGALDRTE